MSSSTAPRRTIFFTLMTSSLLILTSTSAGNDETEEAVGDRSLGIPNPGLKVRVLPSGLKYAAGVAVKALCGRIGQLRLPDQSGSAKAPLGRAHYSLTNMKVAQVTTPVTDVVPSSAMGLTVTLANGGVLVSGNWKIKYAFSSHGTFDASVNGVTISLSAIVEASTSGQPTIRSTGCSCSVAMVKISLHGGSSGRFKPAIGKVEQELRSKIPTIVCSKARQYVDVTAARKLASLKTKVQIGSNLTLDYSLVAAPAYSSAYIDSFHKGEFFYVGDPSEAPFQPRQLSTTAPPPRMLAFWMSDYVVNTAGYVMHKHGKFNLTITRKNLPKAEQNLLDISCCSTCKCIGRLLPSGVSERFPNASAELELATASAPTVNVNVSGVLVNITGITKIQARLVNGSSVYLLTFGVQATSAAIPSLNGSVLYAKVNSLSAKVTVVDSAVGPVDVDRLNVIVNLVIKGKVVPMLNKVGSRGYPLPHTGHVQFVNGGLQLEQDALCLYTDVQLTVSATTSWTLDNDTLPQPTVNNRLQPALLFQPLK